MEQNLKDFIIQKLGELMSAPSCCAEAKLVAQNWIDSVGTDNEKEQTQKLITELEKDIVTIDELITFASSEGGIQVFGEEIAKNIVDHAKEIKEAGAKYYDCPACTSALAIIEKKEEFL